MGVAHSRETSVIDYIRGGAGAGEEDKQWGALSLSAVGDVARVSDLLRKSSVPVFGGTVRSVLLAADAGDKAAASSGSTHGSSVSGAPTPAAAIIVGSKVQLAIGFESVSDAGSGPLRPGDVGTVVKVRGAGDQTSFNVKGPADGRTWWYRRSAIRIAVETGPLAVGSKVVLRRGYTTEGDAAGGPLSPGDVGEIVANDRSSKPWKVKGNDGTTS